MPRSRRGCQGGIAGRRSRRGGRPFRRGPGRCIRGRAVIGLSRGPRLRAVPWIERRQRVRPTPITRHPEGAPGMANISPVVEALTPDLIALRRDFHRHPELGFQEVRTAGIVAERLRALGYTVRTGVGKTGVTGFLKCGAPGKTLLLRADMDALPIREEADVAWKSERSRRDARLRTRRPYRHGARDGGGSGQGGSEAVGESLLRVPAGRGAGRGRRRHAPGRRARRRPAGCRPRRTCLDPVADGHHRHLRRARHGFSGQADD